ncbi:KTSC domain-containing protein [Paenibacillus aceti]|uniref:KTSC domain-containing protein n=1 Tax=Paenibacillus aceti TaxID=1820010 RepID=A0ABQ1VPC0_9BACL|nr:KTSC domain-containing protein [Paenibacillus aceti]GGF86441.1 hypothetical protein GCM10010913_04930 [Paenibacillus aceti]
MELIPVASSNVAAVGYDESKQVFYIQFKSSQKVYEHHQVPKEVYNDLINADSVGSFYARNIKKQYPAGGTA